MRRLVWIAMVAACGKSSAPAKGVDAAAAAKPADADLGMLAKDIADATAKTDPAAVLAAVAKQCGAACPCVDPAKACKPEGDVPGAWAAAGRYVAEQAKLATPNQRDELADALDGVVAWLPPAAAVSLPAASNVVGASAWGVVVIGKDGAISVGRAARVKLSLDGATVEPGVAPAAVADAKAAAAKLDDLGPSLGELAGAADLAKALENTEREGEMPSEDPTESESPCIDPQGGFGYGVGGIGSGGGAATVPSGKYGTIGKEGSHPAAYVYAATAAGGTALVMADAALPSRTLLEALARLSDQDKLLAVGASGGTAALAMLVCGSGNFGVATVIDVPGDVRAAYDAASKAAGKPVQAELRVADAATAADVIGAIDTLLGAGATRLAISTAAMVKNSAH